MKHAKSEPLKHRVTRKAERRSNKPNYRICITGVEPIVIRRTTDDGLGRAAP